MLNLFQHQILWKCHRGQSPKQVRDDKKNNITIKFSYIEMWFQIRYNINMLKKLFIIFVFLFMASSTAFADGIVPVICSMKEFNYCKDIKYIRQYTRDEYYRDYDFSYIYILDKNIIKQYTRDEYYRNYDFSYIYISENSK